MWHNDEVRWIKSSHNDDGPYIPPRTKQEWADDSLKTWEILHVALFAKTEKLAKLRTEEVVLEEKLRRACGKDEKRPATAAVRKNYAEIREIERDIYCQEAQNRRFVKTAEENTNCFSDVLLVNKGVLKSY
jgi:hypothetical protein